MKKHVWSGWVNGYVNYLDELCFSKAYKTKSEARKGRRRKDVTYVGDPVFVSLKK